MKFELEFERVYPHPVEKVWKALTDPRLLGKWLMETDFAPVVGREFNMWCDDGEGGTDRYICKLLALEPPRYMRWSWLLDGSQHLGETEVTFRLEETGTGTCLSIVHSGDRDPKIIEAFKGGWPWKMEILDDLLGQ
ncbi:polyketide cyclase [Maritimibacter sp. 55A14]|uniref:SRPBCC family protein n=1 Tax=Maritimibacter sp. 55A14 TaxID=2174844 RepID=UPI000D611517|nr:SRPBCC domain-containing protein [Maritimibacter sp. 55A14]PWE29371.1 polyketide cyclase [Maritimibacter sp. 55A14]